MAEQDAISSGATDSQLPLADLAFEAKLSEDRARIQLFYDSLGEEDDPEGAANPANQFAPEHFQIYLKHRPSSLATRALGVALSMWGRVKGASGVVREAVTQIAPDEDVWSDEVVDGVLYALWEDNGFAASLAELEEIARRVTPDQSRAMMLHTLSSRWMDTGALAKAREACEEILRLDISNSPWYIEPNARGCLYEIECLNVGQPAPDFSLPDIDGSLVELRQYRGRVILLSFWAAWCGACPREFPHLRHLAEIYPSNCFAIVGVALDEDMATLREVIQREELHWPHICGGTCWDDPLAKLYNTRGIPNSYLLDVNGLIVAKHTPAEGIGDLVDNQLLVTSALSDTEKKRQ